MEIGVRLSELKDAGVHGEYLLPPEAGDTLVSAVMLWRWRTNKTITIHRFDLACSKY
jgi:hypothetical protein